MSILRPILRPILQPVLRSPLEPGTGSLTASVRAMFGTSKGVMYDLTDKSKLYQDSARTTLVSANGDPIGSVTDLSPNGKHASQATAASRPLFQGYANFDGVDDSVVTPDIDFTGTAQVTVVASFRPGSTSQSAVVESQVGSGGFFSINANFFTLAGKIGFQGAGTGGTDTIETTASTYGSGVTSVAALSVDLSKPAAAQKLIARINGVAGLTSVAVDNADAARMGGNVPLHIGRRSNNTIPLTGRIYRMIVIGRTLTAAELAQAERWCALPAGVTLA